MGQVGEPVAAVETRTVPAVPARTGLVLATVCLCQLMVVLDVSVVNVALPSIGRDLGFSPGALSWVVNAYTLVFGGLLLLGGRIADLVGHRRAMLAGLALFGVASVLGGFASDPGQLIAARAGQGLAGALLAPVSLTVIMVSFAEGPVRNRAVAIWAMVAASGIAVGVLAGGLLTELLNWRWVLFVNVPIVVVALALALRAVPGTRPARVRRPDIAGAVLATAALTLLVYGTLAAGEQGWTDASTVASLALAVACGAAFLVWEARFAAEPLVRLGIFRTRTVWVADLIVVFIGAATVAGFYFAWLFLQEVLHYGPLEAGAAFLPFCAGITVGSFASARLAARLGNRVLLAGGLLFGAVGMFWFSRMDAGSTFWSGFLGPSLVASLGIGVCMVANTAMGTSGVAAHEAGLVSGLLNASRQCGGSVGLAVLSSLAVAATRKADSADPLGALTAGYSRAFVATGALVLAAAVCAALFVPSPGRRSGEITVTRAA
jgi:EmrB/QacA subfamily drug resistance transporter